MNLGMIFNEKKLFHFLQFSDAHIASLAILIHSALKPNIKDSFLTSSEDFQNICQIIVKTHVKDPLKDLKELCQVATHYKYSHSLTIFECFAKTIIMYNDLNLTQEQIKFLKPFSELYKEQNEKYEFLSKMTDINELEVTDLIKDKTLFEYLKSCIDDLPMLLTKYDWAINYLALYPREVISEKLRNYFMNPKSSKIFFDSFVKNIDTVRNIIIKIMEVDVFDIFHKNHIEPKITCSEQNITDLVLFLSNMKAVDLLLPISKHEFQELWKYQSCFNEIFLSKPRYYQNFLKDFICNSPNEIKIENLDENVLQTFIKTVPEKDKLDLLDVFVEKHFVQRLSRDLSPIIITDSEIIKNHIGSLAYVWKLDAKLFFDLFKKLSLFVLAHLIKFEKIQFSSFKKIDFKDFQMEKSSLKQFIRNNNSDLGYLKKVAHFPFLYQIFIDILSKSSEFKLEDYKFSFMLYSRIQIKENPFELKTYIEKFHANSILPPSVQNKLNERF